MKANELKELQKSLRLGNLLKWKSYANEGISEVVFLENRNPDKTPYHSPYFQLASGANPNECEPIPLTEEWLIKFGFIKFNGWFFLETRFTSIYISPLTGYCSIGANEEYDFPYKVLYIHQLQNLYFALTGEELKSTN